MATGKFAYYMLTILTDGMCHDEDGTIKAIIAASKLPISIVIIGIGSANFDLMIKLDGDDVPIIGENGLPIRDIVQFVSVKDFIRNSELDFDGFRKAVLEEIPAQIVEYMNSINITPEHIRFQNNPIYSTYQTSEINNYQQTNYSIDTYSIDTYSPSAPSAPPAYFKI